MVLVTFSQRQSPHTHIFLARKAVIRTCTQRRIASFMSSLSLFVSVSVSEFMLPSEAKQAVDCRVAPTNLNQTAVLNTRSGLLLKVDTAVIHVREFALRLHSELSSATENRTCVSMYYALYLPSVCDWHHSSHLLQHAMVIIDHNSYSTKSLARLDRATILLPRDATRWLLTLCHLFPLV